jgi:hypothetical protein
MGSKRERNKPVEPTYTSDEMYEIIHEFATHIVKSYGLRSIALCQYVQMSPEALMTVWENEMAEAVAAD